MPVKPDRILKELGDLWITMGKPESPDAPASESAGVLRACSMTLVVFVDDEEDSMALGETLANIMREHPSRTIVVRLKESAQENSPGELEARVFGQCWMPFGQRRQICCEEIELTATMDRLADIPSIVAPLEVPDLPRVVWFRSSRIAEASDIGGILALGDKIIVDSARRGAPAFAELRALATSGLIVGDLAWTRLTRLRQLLAQLLPESGSLRRITLEYCGSEPSPEGRYLQAWLRSSLGSATVDLRRNGTPGNGAVSTIRVDSGATIRLEAGCAEFESGTLRERANLSSESDQDLLSEELGIVVHDRVFERALERLTIWTARS